jgi:hypothetical protein
MKTYYTTPSGAKIEYFRPDAMSFQDYLNLLLCTEARAKAKKVR